MIGLDTNVLVRYLAQDDKRQSARASQLIESELSEGVPGFVGLIVLVELCWVLKRLYAATQAELRQTIQDLLNARQLVVERRDVVLLALQRWDVAKADFADALISAIAADAGCAETVTFDVSAAKLPGVRLLAPPKPGS
ncbi:MAG TPA: type II toxin-antitoxin system VapC family toxin [Albitalea sp.]|uniref:PIN domain-containing protein n=1 Tax=Piscinibacter sp. TaxID=1903157 RepID=UPI002ED1034F